MSQLGKTIPNNRSLSETKTVKNQRLTPRQIFEQRYGLHKSHVKSATTRPIGKNANFFNNAYLYCLAELDDSFRRELHYISSIKYN